MDRNKRNTLNVYYCDIPNMGDQLNPLIIRRLWGIDIVKGNVFKSDISAIGSGLGAFTTRGHCFYGIGPKMLGLFCKPIQIWGTGFIQRRKDGVEGTFFRKMNFCAVRGNLSKERAEKIKGSTINIPVGDAGILASFLLNEPLQKKYDVGIIPHWREKEHIIFQKLLKHYPNSVFIDVNNDPLGVVKTISRCKVIISSSLHGLIVADSFHIPNVHIVVTNNMIGDGFKFDDYYSAYGKDHIYVCLEDLNYPNLEWIVDNYRITEHDVESMKQRMIESFPFEYDVNKNCVCLKQNQHS